MSDNPLLTYGPLVGQLGGLTESLRTMPPPVRPLADIDNPLAGPSLADAWSKNAQMASDYIAQQRQAAIDRGELDPETGWPTPLGNRRSAMALGTGLVLGSTAPEFRVNPLKVYHGTPHTFAPTPANPLGEFDLRQIGTGEGAQVYGHGAYLAENEAIAKHYRDTLSEGIPMVADSPYDPFDPTHYAASLVYHHGSPEAAIADIDAQLPRLDAAIAQERKKGWKESYRNERESLVQARATIADRGPDLVGAYRPSGRMYEAELHVDPDHMLHWDKPYSQQSPYVQERLNSLRGWMREDESWPGLGDPTGEDIYRELALKAGNAPENGPYWVRDFDRNDAGATAALRDAGIPALRYVDADSRGVFFKHQQEVEAQHSIIGDAEQELRDLYHDLANEPAGSGRDRLMLELEQTQAFLEGEREHLANLHHEAPDVTHNFVVFDPKTINIVRRYGIGALMGGGAAAGAAQQGGE